MQQQSSIIRYRGINSTKINKNYYCRFVRFGVFKDSEINFMIKLTLTNIFNSKEKDFLIGISLIWTFNLCFLGLMLNDTFLRTL
jgi:hypothetical protein